MHVVDQEAIDQKLRDADGTADKSALGANAILAISLAVARVRNLVSLPETYVTTS